MRFREAGRILAHVRLIRRLVALAIPLIVAGVVWSTGALDSPLHLYEAGLNAGDCFRDYSGTVSCGSTAHARCQDRAGHGFEIAETTCYRGSGP
jgi:hypothetical protein